MTDQIPVDVQAAPTADQVPAEAEEDSDDAQDGEGAAEAGAAGGKFLRLIFVTAPPEPHPTPHKPAGLN